MIWRDWCSQGRFPLVTELKQRFLWCVLVSVMVPVSCSSLPLTRTAAKMHTLAALLVFLQGRRGGGVLALENFLIFETDYL